MKQEHSAPIVFLVLIADRKKKNDLLALISDTGGQIINTIYGKGSVRASAFADLFGFVPDEDKIIVTCLMSRQISDNVLEILIKRFHFNKPNTGLAFTIPVEGLVY